MRESESKVKLHQKPLLLGLVAVVMWSTIATAFKLGLRHQDPLQLLWIGAVWSWLLFTVAIVVAPKTKINRTQVIHAGLLGLLNPLAYYVVLLTAYDLLPAHIAQPLNYTWAITTALLAIPMLKQKLSARMFTGIVIGYLGVLILLMGGEWTLTIKYNTTGVMLALASTLIWAIYWIGSIRVQLPPWWFMWIGFTIALPILTVFCLLYTGFPELNVWNVGTGAWIGFFEMGFAFLLWQRAMSATQSAAALSQLIFLSPLISLGLIVTVLGETVHWSALVALFFIIGGFLLVNRSQTQLKSTQ